MILPTDEAEYAECETCSDSDLRDAGIECEGCGGWYCRSCWKGPQYGKNPHWCGRVTDSLGRLVKVGDRLVYPYDRIDHVYEVEGMPQTYVDNMICYGFQIKDTHKKRVVIRPRLMLLWVTDD